MILQVLGSINTDKSVVIIRDINTNSLEKIMTTLMRDFINGHNILKLDLPQG